MEGNAWNALVARQATVKLDSRRESELAADLRAREELVEGLAELDELRLAEGQRALFREGEAIHPSRLPWRSLFEYEEDPARRKKLERAARDLGALPSVLKLKPAEAPKPRPAPLIFTTAQIVNSALRAGTSCTKTPFIARCRVRGPLKGSVGCRRRNCVTCDEDVARAAGDRVKRRLDARPNPKAPVFQTVFTIPPELRDRYADRASWRALRRRVAAMLREEAGLLYAVEYTHPVGEKRPEAFAESDLFASPALGELFTPHLNFLWIQRDGFRHKLDVPRLKNRFKELLEEDGEVKREARELDLHNEFTQHWKTKEIIHHCRYVARPFAGWSSWLPNGAWYGTRPKHLPPIPPCEKCGEPHLLVAFGRSKVADFETRHGPCQRSTDGPTEEQRCQN